MVLKKQTVWLLTMLTLMVVLSAYYLFNYEPIQTSTDFELQEMTMEEMDWIESMSDLDTNFVVRSSNDPINYFINYRLDRESRREQMVEQYQKVISSSNSAEVIAEAKAKQDNLYDTAEAEGTLESLIRAEGYEEAIVIADPNKVNVIVRSDDSLEKEQVLSIIHLVRNHLQVPGNKVSVSFR